MESVEEFVEHIRYFHGMDLDPEVDDIDAFRWAHRLTHAKGVEHPYAVQRAENCN